MVEMNSDIVIFPFKARVQNRGVRVGDWPCRLGLGGKSAPNLLCFILLTLTKEIITEKDKMSHSRD